jgi:hypothetical protein
MIMHAKRWKLAAIALCLVAAAAAPRQGDNVDMLEFCGGPNGAPRFYYPREALGRHLEGHVRLDCIMQGPEGRPSSCLVLEERPRRYNFADAALRIACNYHISPEEFASAAPRIEGEPPSSVGAYLDEEGRPHKRFSIPFELGR